MSRFQLGTTWHWWKTPRTRKISDYMFNKRRQPIDANTEMTEKLKLWHTFKAVRVKMFQQELWNSLKQIKEIETSVKKDIKKNQIEVLELKNTLEIKRSVNRLKSRIEKIKNQWTGKRTYINLNDREKRDKMKSLRNM